MTIAAPELVVDKSGPATMNLGEWGNSPSTSQNIGLSDAWDVTLRRPAARTARRAACAT